MRDRACSDDSAAATRLAARALAQALTRHPGATVLDVGAGTGTLAAWAQRHGARRVLGIERDPSQVAAAARAWPGVPMLQASAQEVLPELGFDVVVANLPDPPLTSLVSMLSAAAGHTLIVGGARLWQGAALRRALLQCGWSDIRTGADDGWCCFVATHPNDSRASRIRANHGQSVDSDTFERDPYAMARSKEPGMEIEEAKSRLRVEEVDAVAADCADCTLARTASADPTAYCDAHLMKILLGGVGSRTP